MASATKSSKKAPVGNGGADFAATSVPTATAIALALAPLLAEQLQTTLATAVALGPDALFSVDEASAILRRSSGNPGKMEGGRHRSESGENRIA